MPKKKITSFSEFIAEPHIGTSLIVIGLIALLFSIMQFSKAIGGY